MLFSDFRNLGAVMFFCTALLLQQLKFRVNSDNYLQTVKTIKYGLFQLLSSTENAVIYWPETISFAFVLVDLKTNRVLQEVIFILLSSSNCQVETIMKCVQSCFSFPRAFFVFFGCVDELTCLFDLIRPGNVFCGKCLGSFTTCHQLQAKVFGRLSSKHSEATAEATGCQTLQCRSHLR